MKDKKMRWRTAPVRYLVFLVWFFAGCGDAFKVETIKEEQEFLPADQLVVTRVPLPPPLRTLVLVDTSGSNTFRGKMNQEVMALVGKTEVDNDTCLIPITSDSRQANSQPHCLGQIGGITCEHPPVRSSDFYNPQEEAEYVAARQRLEGELAACWGEVTLREQTDRPQRLELMGAKLQAYPVAKKTDITGAIYRALQQVTAALATDVWIYSDMEEDPLYEGRAPLAINLAGVNVHVRQLTPYGRGYSTAMQDKWLPKFQEWGDPQMDWKDFTLGEFVQTLAVTTPEPEVVEAVPSGEEAAVPVTGEPKDQSSGGPAIPAWTKPTREDHGGMVKP